MRHVKNVFWIVLFTLLMAPFSTKAAFDHDTHPARSEMKGDPIMNQQFNMWLVVATDPVTGYDQIFLQYLNTSTTSSPTSYIPPIQVTTSSFNKSQPIWGTFLESSTVPELDFPKLRYGHFPYGAAPSTSTDCPQDESILFYYLGNTSGTPGENDIYLGCIVGLDPSSSNPSNPSVRLTDVRLTGNKGTTKYNVQEITASSHTKFDMQDSSVPNSAPRKSYSVAFTDSNGDLHLVLHSAKTIYESGNESGGFIATDPNWTSTDMHWSWPLKFSGESIRHPRFNLDGDILTFGIQPKAGDNWQVGTLSVRGENLSIVTSINRDVWRPRFAHSGNYTMFFEMEEDASNKHNFAAAVINITNDALGYSYVGDWCEDYYAYEDNTNHRRNIDVKQLVDNNYMLTYEKEQLDGKNDIYVFYADTSDSLRVGGDGIVCPSFTTKPIATKRVHHNPSKREIQITCQNNNMTPMFFPKANNDPTVHYDASFSHVTPSSYRSVIMRKEASTGTGYVVTHIYDTENPAQCVDTCYENADGSPIEDSNGFEDGDGKKDSCEEFCSASYLLANPTGDWDKDGLLNNADNCPCSYNPAQFDPDGDGVGESNPTAKENGCDNCPGLANPADLDNNNNAIVDFLDGDYRQTDTDFDGYGDACDEEVHVCGTEDKDLDATPDLCDNCIDLYNADQIDSDNDGIGDLCDICPENHNPEQKDADGDGIGDACDPCPETKETSCDDKQVTDDITARTPMGFGVFGGNCSIAAPYTAGTNLFFWMLLFLGRFIVVKFRK